LGIRPRFFSVSLRRCGIPGPAVALIGKPALRGACGAGAQQRREGAFADRVLHLPGQGTFLRGFCLLSVSIGLLTPVIDCRRPISRTPRLWSLLGADTYSTDPASYRGFSDRTSAPRADSRCSWSPSSNSPSPSLQHPCSSHYTLHSSWTPGALCRNTACRGGRHLRCLTIQRHWQCLAGRID